MARFSQDRSFKRTLLLQRWKVSCVQAPEGCPPFEGMTTLRTHVPSLPWFLKSMLLVDFYLSQLFADLY